MNRFRALKWYLTGSVLLPAAAVFIWQDKLWVHGVFVVWTIFAAAVWLVLERKEQTHRAERTQQAQQNSAIRMLNHHRHDWMNELQVLYGYVRMNKPDKIAACVEKIRERMTAESRVSKLGDAALILFIHAFRTVTNTMQLHVEAADDVDLTELPLDGRNAADSLMDMVNMYRFGVKPSMGEAAKLTLTLSRDESALHVEFSFEGDLLEPPQLAAKCKQLLKRSVFKAETIEPDMKTIALRAQLNR